MELKIESNLIDFITSEATKDGVTVEIWLERKINAHVKRLMRDSLMAELDGVAADDVPAIKEAVTVARHVIMDSKPVPVVDPELIIEP